MWTLVGGGQKKKEQSRKLMKDVMPGACDWIKDKAVKFDPENNSLTTAEGKTVQYNYLVVAMGMQLNFDKVVHSNCVNFHKKSCKDPDLSNF